MSPAGRMGGVNTNVASVCRVAVLMVFAWVGSAMAAPLRGGSAGDAEANAWSVILAAQAEVAPLLAAGRYREAASRYHNLRSRTRDKAVKAYTRYAYDLCQLRDRIAKDRPGQAVLSMDFDDGGIPDSFREGRDVLAWEEGQTFAGSPGALRITRATAEGFLLAETYSAFTIQANTLLTVCFYAHHVSEAKFQVNTSLGNVHYFWKPRIEDGDWNVMTVRLGLDGNVPLPLGTQVHSVAFVSHVTKPDGYAVLDELHVLAHP